MTSPTRHIRLHATTTEDGRGLRQLERDLDSAAGKSDKLGHSMGGVERETKSLEHQIVRTRKEIRNLGEEFERTGDTSLFGDLRKERARLRELERIAKEAGQIGAGAGASALDLGGSGVRPMHAMIAALIGAAAAALPTLGAMIAGVVAGAVGTGGVAGGLLMASKDPRVRTAARHFGDEISQEFFRGGDAFVGPAIESLHILEQAFKDMNLPAAFAKMAPTVTTIAEGLGDLGRNVMPGLNTAFERMGPFAEAAKEGFGDLGDGLSTFLDDVTRSEGAVMGLKTAFHLVNGLILATGKTLFFLSEAFEKWINTQHNLAIAAATLAGVTGDAQGAATYTRLAVKLGEILHPAEQLPEALHAAAGGVASFGEKAELASIATGHLGGALDDTHQAFLDWAGAEIGAEGALDRMQAALDESNGSLDVHKEKGRDAREAVLRFAEAAEVAAQKKYDETGSVKKANEVYEHYRDELIKTLIAAGHTRAEAKRLADQWMAYSKMPDINKSIVITHDDLYRSFRQGERSASGRAGGGPVLPDVPYAINEHLHGGQRVETVTFPAAGMVHPASLTPMGAGNARPVVLNGAGLGDLVFNWLVRQIGDRGGTLAAIGIKP